LHQRAISEASDHVRLIAEKPYLRPYFYDGRAWQAGDHASRDELLAVAELMLNEFASSLMHAAAFPEYPVRGIDRIIMFHLRNGPTLRELLLDYFDRFPFTGLTLLIYKNDSPAGVRQDLVSLIERPGLDDTEVARRRELLEIFESSTATDPIDFTMITMRRRL